MKTGNDFIEPTILLYVSDCDINEIKSIIFL